MGVSSSTLGEAVLLRTNVAVRAPSMATGRAERSVISARWNGNPASGQAAVKGEVPWEGPVVVAGEVPPAQTQAWACASR